MTLLYLLWQVSRLHQTLNGMLQLNEFIGGVATTFIKVAVFSLVCYGRFSNREWVLDPEIPFWHGHSNFLGKYLEGFTYCTAHGFSRKIYLSSC